MPLEMAVTAPRLVLRSGTVTVTVTVIILIVGNGEVTLNELGEVDAVFVVIITIILVVGVGGGGLLEVVVVFPGAAGEAGTSSAKDIAAEGEQMFTRMVILPALPDLDEMGSDFCFGVPTPGGEELGLELAAGEGVVPEEAEILGDVFEDGGGKEMGLFLQFVTGMEGDAAGAVILLTEQLAVRAVPFGEVVPFQGAEGEALRAI
jgi:hypothetical protein